MVGNHEERGRPIVLSAGQGFIKDKLGHIIKVRWRRPFRKRWAHVVPFNTRQAASRLRPRWMHAVFADRECTVPVDSANFPNSEGLWWIDAKGDLQRVATCLEVATKKAPEAGWLLANGETALAAQPLQKIKSPAEVEHARAVRLYNQCQDELCRARRFLMRADKKLKLAQQNHAKWTKMVNRLTIRLSSRGETLASTIRAIEQSGGNK